MAIQHTSRTGKTYYLHVKQSASGKLSHFFSTKADGALADTIPEGYEIYENVQGQVFLRKKTAQVIRPTELALVESALRRHAAAWRYWVEAKGNTIIVYEAANNDGIDKMWESFGCRTLSESTRRRFASYTAMLRFTLHDRQTRAFTTERFCFRGRIDDWIPLAGPAALAAHMRKFVKHLGRESFFELF